MSVAFPSNRGSMNVKHEQRSTCEKRQVLVKRRMVAVASATLVMLVGGGIGALSAPIAAADTVTDKYIGGPNRLYVGHADSEEKAEEPNGNGPAEKAIDGKAETYWHTNWSVGGETAGPH